MAEFPADIMKDAEEAVAGFMGWVNGGNTTASLSEHAVAGMKHSFASTILAERERCLGFCNDFVENVELTGGTIKRFQLSDVNRIAKRSVRYVRDQINGTFDDNWKPLPEDAA